MAKTAELLVTSGADGVRAARRLTAATLQKMSDDLCADAEVVVTELVTNAVLHGAPPIELRVRTGRGWLRIEVTDAGRAIPLQIQRTVDGMTGRGLAVIESLANAWGVEAAGSGKLVWAELGRKRRRAARRQARTNPEALRAGWAAADASSRYEIRLGYVPTELLVAAKAHVDNILRELALMQADVDGEPGLPSKTIDMLLRATDEFTSARSEIKHQAVEAARRGEEFTNLVLHLPISAANAGLRYLMALDEADRQARAARLLTVAAPPSHRVFREWYVRALADQLIAVSHNQPRPPLRPFSLALAQEFDRAGAAQAAAEIHYRYAEGSRD